jgi:hypothetical protein
LDAQSVSFFGAQLATVRWEQGRLEEIIDLYIDGVEHAPGVGMMKGVLAMYLYEAGRRDDAERMVRAASIDGFGVVPDDVFHRYGLGRFAQAAVSVRLP